MNFAPPAAANDWGKLCRCPPGLTESDAPSVANANLDRRSVQKRKTPLRSGFRKSRQ